MLRLKIEKRRTPHPLTVILVAIISVALALAISIVILEIAGYEALNILLQTFKSTYFTKAGNLSLLVYLAPISLCSLSVVVAAKAGLWNVGVEGQFLIGTIVATGIGIYLGEILPPYIALPLIFLASFLAAGLMCYILMLPKIIFGISEILTTVLFNSVIGYLAFYMVYLVWRDPNTMAPQTVSIGENAIIGKMIPGARLHWGIIVALIIVFLIHFFLKKSTVGYEIRAVGEQKESAHYAGLNKSKIYFIAIMISGGLAGIAGMMEVCGVSHRLQPNLASDYGLSGFVIAWVGRLNPIVILIVSYLFAGLNTVGFRLQMAGFPSSIVNIIKGLILFFVLTGEIFTYYKIYFKNREGDGETPKSFAGKIKGFWDNAKWMFAGDKKGGNRVG